jgi:3-oxochol-4-en-24-oyl-CoA dehydrogenase
VAIALQDDQLALADAVSGFVARYAPLEQTRAQLDDLSAGQLPDLWPQLVDQGYATLHLPEPHGGATVLDLAVVMEESGRGLLPGPLLPTSLTSALIGRFGKPDQAAVLERLATGATAAAATSIAGVTATRQAGGYSLSGVTLPVLGAVGAEVLLLGAATGDGEVWVVLETAGLAGLEVDAAAAVDLTRGVGRVHLTDVVVTEDQVLAVGTTHVRALAATLFAAEAVGIVGWCLKSATDYAKLREQFGRTIGSFQSIKHKLARMFIRLHLMSAAAWDAARAFEESDEQALLAGAEAAIICLPTAMELALETITLFGGIGYTWEHDAHLFWRRTMTLNALLAPVEDWQRQLGASTREVIRHFEVELGEEEPEFRARIAQTLADAAAKPEADRQKFLASAGLVVPHYPDPYGLAATAIEQVIIAQEYEKAGIDQPKIVIGEWALPTILAHGTVEQQDEFVPATLRGEIEWCQLFSEPGAGSDLASLTTKAEEVDGGWKLTGQKIWTSNAQHANWGICLARTDPTAPKHLGISYFLVDMKSAGLEIRPLREANGNYLFNEVFFTEVFVPDRLLVGEVNGGWRLARTTLSNERVSMGGMATPRLPLVDMAGRDDLVLDAGDVNRGLGALTAERYALSAMNLRDVVRRLSGLQPGVEGSAMKTAAGWHHTNVAVEAMKWFGPAAAAADGVGGATPFNYLSTPPMLIGGGTLEIQLNVIAERILGLPRD